MMEIFYIMQRGEEKEETNKKGKNRSWKGMYEREKEMNVKLFRRKILWYIKREC